MSTNGNFSEMDIDILQPQKSIVSVNVGGFDTEPLDAEVLSLSPQQGEIAKSSSLWFHMYKGKPNYAFIVKEYHWRAFSLEGEQDCRVRLKVGRDYLFYSGKWGSTDTGEVFDTPKFMQATRVLGTSGLPMNSLSNNGTLAYPDNFPPGRNRVFAVAYENQPVSFFVQNQSDAHDHEIEVYLYGWAIPYAGRDKDSLTKNMLQKLREL